MQHSETFPQNFQWTDNDLFLVHEPYLIRKRNRRQCAVHVHVWSCGNTERPTKRGSALHLPVDLRGGRHLYLTITPSPPRDTTYQPSKRGNEHWLTILDNSLLVIISNIAIPELRKGQEHHVRLVLQNTEKNTTIVLVLNNGVWLFHLSLLVVHTVICCPLPPFFLFPVRPLRWPNNWFFSHSLECVSEFAGNVP